MKAQKFKAVKTKTGFVIRESGKTFSLDPPAIIMANLPPYVEGIGSFLKRVAETSRSDGDLDVEISDEWMPGSAFRAEFLKDEIGGKMYKISHENMVIEGVVWICSEASDMSDGRKEFYVRVSI